MKSAKKPGQEQLREKPAVGLWIRLAKTYALMLNEVRRAQGETELTLAQFDVLAQLLRHPEGMTAGQLSKALLVTAGNVTGLVDRLSARGWVKREQSARDQRVAIVRLTPSGRRTAAREVARQEALVTDLLSGVPTSEQRALSTHLDHLRSTLEVLQTTPRGR